MLAPGPPLAVATPEGVSFAGSRIDALAVCEGRVHRTSAPLRVRFGLAQVRRSVGGQGLRIVHVVFAPLERRPILLGLVRLENGLERPLGVEYNELWDVPPGGYRAAPGACERRATDGLRILADLGPVVRTRPPREPPGRGLALELTLLLPPGSTRTLGFAYAAPPEGDDPEILVRAWRGRVAEELIGVVRTWTGRLGNGTEAVRAFQR